MSARYAWSQLHPVTQEGILANTPDRGVPVCGCRTLTPEHGEPMWWLCQYHAGMDDGADQASARHGDMVDRCEEQAADLADARRHLDHFRTEIATLAAERDEARRLAVRWRSIAGHNSTPVVAWKNDHPFPWESEDPTTEGSGE